MDLKRNQSKYTLSSSLGQRFIVLTITSSFSKTNNTLGAFQTLPDFMSKCLPADLALRASQCLSILPKLLDGRHDSEMSKRNRINKIKTRVNTGLKMIAEEVGIEQNMHTYIFRHTFARKVLEKHGIWHLKETLGHKSVTTTQAYATSLSNKELEVVDDVY